jgi:hypothetical protein
VLAVTALACGGSNGVVGSGGDGGNADASADGSVGTDGGGSTDGSTPTDGSAGGEGGPSWGTPSPPACAAKCSGGQLCIEGACACPVYQSFCGGACIPTVNDPDNCGGCGMKCGAGQVCSAGSCSSSCLPGLVACGGQCVDPMTDDANCGGCAAPCGVSEGCIWGTCGPATVKTSSATCAGGGPVPSVSLGAQTYCLGQLGLSSFLPWAVCSCKDFATDQESVVVDAYDSTKGPYTGPTTPGGNAGVDGYVNVNNPMNVTGALWVGGGATLSLETRGLTVCGDLHVGSGGGNDGGVAATGTVTAEGQVTVGGDAYATGGIESGDPFAVTGALHQPNGATNATSVTYGSLVPGPVPTPAPCPCGAADVFPIANVVMARQLDNDDDAIGLNPDLLDANGQVARLDLPCGNFYLSSIAENQPVVVYVHGRVALYVGGDVASQVAFALDPTAELDVFVGGSLSINQPVVVGSPSYPSLVRFFIAGMVDVDSTLDVRGYLYAPNATYDLNDTTTVYGGLFTGDFGGRDVFVHYDRALLDPGPSCLGP